MTKLFYSRPLVSRLFAAHVLFAILALPFLVALGVAWPSPSAAGIEASYVEPKAANRTYRIHVFGDSLGRGMWHGLHMAFKKDRHVRVTRRIKSATGLVRDDVYDWQRAIKRFSRERFDIAVVMIGGNDGQDIRVRGKRLRERSKAWQREYMRRIDRFTSVLKRKGVAVYWVGLPVTRLTSLNRDYKVLNKLFRNRAERNGVKFISTWRYFRDGNGHYTAFGKALDGRKRKLRKNDGRHFTTHGNRMFAEIVARHLRKDIRQARRLKQISLSHGSE